jgi:hypothetical protein
LDASRSVVLAPSSSSVSATNVVFVGYPWWTLLIPSGVAAPASGSPYRVEVNNSNPLDASKKNHYVNPTMWGVKSIADSIGNDQSSASAADFDNNWINLGDLTTSGFNSSFAYRFLRIVHNGGFTGTASAFKAYLWTYGMLEMR